VVQYEAGRLGLAVAQDTAAQRASGATPGTFSSPLRRRRYVFGLGACFASPREREPPGLVGHEYHRPLLMRISLCGHTALSSVGRACRPRFLSASRGR
jgi:hypothetical protein